MLKKPSKNLPLTDRPRLPMQARRSSPGPPELRPEPEPRAVVDAISSCHLFPQPPPRPRAATGTSGTGTPRSRARLAALGHHLRERPASPRSSGNQPVAPRVCAGSAGRTAAAVVASAALSAVAGWLLGYRRGQRDAWLDEVARADPTAEQRAATAVAMQNKANRFAKTGEQLRAAKVGQRRTESRKVGMVDWPPPPSNNKDVDLGDRDRVSDDVDDEDDDDPDVT